MKKFWWKSALVLTAGSVFQLTNGCLESVVQRILVAVNFD